MSYEYWTETRSGGSTATKSGRRAERVKSPTPAGSRSLAQLSAAAVGAVFLLVGILGFVPWVVRMFGELSFIGPESDAKLLGLFEISVVHNIVHMLFGVGLLAARRSSWSVRYLLIGGVTYAIVFLYGLAVVDSSSSVNFLPVNTADNVLHLGLAVGMIALGVVSVLALRRNPTTA